MGLSYNHTTPTAILTMNQNISFVFLNLLLGLFTEQASGYRPGSNSNGNNGINGNLPESNGNSGNSGHRPGTNGNQNNGYRPGTNDNNGNGGYRTGTNDNNG